MPASKALHPERESLATLKNIRQPIGAYNFASQYQQSPIPLGGAMVKTDWLNPASSRLFDLNGEANRVRKKQSSAIIP
jgi:hypothetical protein